MRGSTQILTANVDPRTVRVKLYINDHQPDGNNFVHSLPYFYLAMQADDFKYDTIMIMYHYFCPFITIDE